MMSDDAMTRLEQRIARLEIVNRRWRRFGACTALVLACLGLMAAQRSNVLKADQIEARRIVIRDAKGHEVVILGMIDNKFPGMRLQYPDTGSNAMYFTSADHSTIALMDQNGASSITLNSGTAKAQPNISMVRVEPGGRAKRLFQAP